MAPCRCGPHPAPGRSFFAFKGSGGDMTDSPQLENGYIRIATEIWVELTKYLLSGEEMKCLMFIIRQTYGWIRKTSTITLTQFSQATEMVKPSVCRALNKLKAKNLIIVNQTANESYPTYGFNKKYKSWKPLTKQLTLTKRLTIVNQTANDRLPNGKSHLLKDTSKDTITKKGENGACEWPSDFCLTENLRHYATSKGIDPKQLDAFFDDFKYWAESKGAKYKSWEAAFKTRVNKAPEYGKQFCKMKDPWEDV